MSDDSNDIFSGQMRLMVGMGFTDPEVNRRALKQAGGKLSTAVDLIVEGKVNADDEDDDIPLAAALNLSPTVKRTRTPEPAIKYRFPPLSVEAQKKIVQLHQMGFKDEGKARHALSKSKWDLEDATILLLEKGDELESGFSATEVIRQSRPTEDLAGMGGSSTSVGGFGGSPYGAAQTGLGADPFGSVPFGGGSGYPQPAANLFQPQPSYQQPSYQQPSYQQPSYQQPSYTTFQPAAPLFNPTPTANSFAVSQPAPRTQPDPFDPFGDEFAISQSAPGGAVGNPFTSPASSGFPSTAAANQLDPSFLRQQLRPTGYQFK
ncbi:hypothetical protein HK097_008440 [Rhizophlyctis rosea]|uniref:UBA domain-containing protein n=1 Tax=Rhizophlyctis rosea TaxID=64517 RepID=A0AAD5X8Y0_9FUNG|nr:hypothetical protein HK097_008440 [Rhizophlyctis rosea]